MNPTLLELIAAAKRRGLSHSFPAGVPNDDFLVLSHAEREITVQKTKTPFLSTVQGKLATNKFLSGKMMEEAGLPVAPKRLIRELTVADGDFLRQHRELIVKPNQMDRGIAVTERVTTREALQEGFEKARVHGPVLLEKFIRAREYRILVIDGQAVATLERKPVTVVGEGRSTLRQLIDRLNEDPRRGSPRENKPLRFVRPTPDMIRRLSEDGHDLDEIVPVGRIVQISHANHLDSGGIACDRTAEAHPDNLALATRAARLFKIDVAGIDFLCADISKSFRTDSDAALLEVNPGPDIRWHLYPAEGKPRPVADLFVDYLWSKCFATSARENP